MRPMTLGEVARLYGCSDSTVRRLDDELKPVRTAYGVRIYDRDVVEKYASKRGRAA